MATKDSPCLQMEWLTHPAAQSGRGIRLPLVYEIVQQASLRQYSKRYGCSAEQSRMFRTVANVFFCVERCGCPPSAVKYKSLCWLWQVFTCFPSYWKYPWRANRVTIRGCPVRLDVKEILTTMYVVKHGKKRINPKNGLVKRCIFVGE